MGESGEGREGNGKGTEKRLEKKELKEGRNTKITKDHEGHEEKLINLKNSYILEQSVLEVCWCNCLLHGLLFFGVYKRVFIRIR